MKEKQRECAKFGNLVMEGRDIGTHVFPGNRLSNSTSTPALQERSQRRAAEGVRENLAARDQRDSERAAAPLMIALGATVINNSRMTAEQTSARILNEVRKKLRRVHIPHVTVRRDEPDATKSAGIVFRALFRCYFRWRVFNPERVPVSGPVILACNHASFLDPPLAGAGLRRPINYLARASLFRFPVAGGHPPFLGGGAGGSRRRNGRRTQSHSGPAGARRRDHPFPRRHAYAGRPTATRPFAASAWPSSNPPHPSCPCACSGPSTPMAGAGAGPAHGAL